jgi:3-phosphoshikimate 1-carboxyvinyltransferase
MTQRVCAAALLHKGKTIIKNFGSSKDEIAAIKIIQQLGARVQVEATEMLVESNGTIQGNVTIDCEESGLAARLFSPIAAIAKSPIRIAAKGSLLNRPMFLFEEILTQLNVELSKFKGHLPFDVCGPLKAQNILIDGSLGSQFISGLLFAFASTAKEEVSIDVNNLVSKPYIDLTLEVLEHFGKKIKHGKYQTFTIDPSVFIEKGTVEVNIEGDWSSAAFWIAAATINGSVSLKGLNKESNQADKLIVKIVEEIGAKIEWKNEVLEVRSSDVNAFESDLTDAPDLFPILAVLAAACKGKSKLIGVHRLIYKESNRAEHIAQLLNQLRVSFFIDGNALMIDGANSFPSILYHCPNDHRMAMAAALASTYSEGKIEIRNAECVEKSYPKFWMDLESHTL